MLRTCYAEGVLFVKKFVLVLFNTHERHSHKKNEEGEAEHHHGDDGAEAINEHAHSDLARYEERIPLLIHSDSK